jgi:hypothetical protein
MNLLTTDDAENTEGFLNMIAELLQENGAHDARSCESDLKPKAYGLKPESNDLTPKAYGLKPETEGLKPETEGLKPEPTFVCTGCGVDQKMEDGIAPKCCPACGCGQFRVVVAHGWNRQGEPVRLEDARSFLNLAKENAVVALEEMGRQWNLAFKPKMRGLKQAIRTMEQAAEELGS